MKFNTKQLKKMADSVRALALHAVRCAMSGHIGIVLGASNIITTVYANFLRRGQDRFVLSAGHGSAMLYAVLKLSGYDIGDIESFRKLGGLPGHPEFGIDGVWATTGPLGQGVGNAVGMALSAKICQADERVYCLCGDGDLIEGVAQESIAFAGQYRLNNLVLLWDDNGISIDGTALTDINVPMRMRAAGWRVFDVSGLDFKALDDVLCSAMTSDRPVFIRCRDIIGYGSRLAGTPGAHGLALGASDMDDLIKKFISPQGDLLWAQVAKDAPAKYVFNPMDACVDDIPAPDAVGMISTRELSGMYLSAMMSAGVRLIGGSADLSQSTNVKTSLHRDITPSGFVGNFINYGVREFAMGAIMNGLAATGLRPYGSTFLAFSDYMRPAIRLSALSHLPVIYVFSHDSIFVGQDGPTHQPVEQLPSLRLIPELNVFRPCNGAEVAYAWRRAISDSGHPSCIILSRQKIRQVATPHDADIARGGYIIYSESLKHGVRATIIATGAEVPLAIDVARKLGPGVQVVSMPSVGDFRRQDASYKKKILRGYVVAIEASASASWFEFADAVVGIDSFGVSGPGDLVYSHFGFDADSIARDIHNRLK